MGSGTVGSDTVGSGTVASGTVATAPSGADTLDRPSTATPDDGPGPADGTQPARATIAEVAKRAGVSKQTVSNVLNFPERVSDATADRVRAAIDELRFRPSRLARQLRTRRSGVLALRMELAEANLVFDRFLHGLTAAAAAADHRVMLYAASNDDDEIAEWAELLQERDVDGFVLTASHRDDAREAYLSAAGAPFVSFGRPWDPGVECTWVDVDGATGCALAVEHLRSLGHRRIAFLGWPEGSGVGDDRLAGWARAVSAAGLELRPPFRVENEVSAGRDAAARLLRADPPSAVVCASDTLALGVQTAAAAAGLTVGRDLSVVGFDDSTIAQAAGLTSVAQPLAAAAQAAVRLLLHLIEHPSTAPAHALLVPTLVVRTSTGPPR